MNKLEDFPYLYAQNTEFSDLDPLRHVNNKAVIAYYENARTRLLMQFFGHQMFVGVEDATLAAVLVDMSVTFAAEVHFPHVANIGSAVSHIGNSSFSISQGLFQNEVYCGSCKATLVVVANGRPEPIPDDIRHRMTEYQRDNF